MTYTSKPTPWASRCCHGGGRSSRAARTRRRHFLKLDMLARRPAGAVGFLPSSLYVSAPARGGRAHARRPAGSRAAGTCHETSSRSRRTRPMAHSVKAPVSGCLAKEPSDAVAAASALLPLSLRVRSRSLCGDCSVRGGPPFSVVGTDGRMLQKCNGCLSNGPVAAPSSSALGSL